LIRILKYMPKLLQKIIKSTHGSKIGAFQSAILSQIGIIMIKMS